MVEVEGRREVHCARCGRRVETMPAAAGKWRCPECLRLVDFDRRGRVLRRLPGLLVEALGVFGLAAFVGDQAGVVGWLLPLAVLPLIVLAGKQTGDDEEPRPYIYPAPYTTDQWLDEARASYGRGTHISTLAVRYGVEPDWLEEQLGPRASGGGAR